MFIHKYRSYLVTAARKADQVIVLQTAVFLASSPGNKWKILLTLMVLIGSLKTEGYNDANFLLSVVASEVVFMVNHDFQLFVEYPNWEICP